MTNFSHYTPWTWGAHQFVLAVTGNEWPAWFARQTFVHVEPILGSSTRYVDIGGTTWQPLDLRALFDTVAARDAFVAAIGQTLTLSSPGGQSIPALLVAASPSQIGQLAVSDATFERV